ncbi:major capsid protein [Furfurilactobacillus rossiae]|uniref:phage capsid protein n=1 Tax=Furfurilactobacillus rossiae TaxID=231049 RepID=UPI0015BFA0F2|nr:phage capsid protein [Furfurilactobacillus rossiae]QLE64006.1 major capsid protein [Furfurilactobacillus rossiae]
MAGENNDLGVRTYQSQFKGLLQAVFKKQAYFGEFFGGGLEALDGVTNTKRAFSLKTSDIPVVIATGDVTADDKSAYKKDKNVAFGTGTGNSSRFGERTEVIYGDSDVNYSWDWVFHEGIDHQTVNADFDGAVADRLDLQAQAKVLLFDKQGGLFISKNADHAETLADFSADKVLALFNKLANEYVEMEAVGQKIAWVNPELYNALVDHPLTVTAKSSAANIDSNNILNFKGFSIREVPESKFQTGEVAYTSIANVGRQFTGINTARTINSEDFDGVALQGAGKAGEFILPANKKAVIKVNGQPAQA